MKRQITISSVTKALKEIRKWSNLRKFQNDMTSKFEKKYKISSGQVNFLICVVAAERIKLKSA